MTNTHTKQTNLGKNKIATVNLFLGDLQGTGTVFRV